MVNTEDTEQQPQQQQQQPQQQQQHEQNDQDPESIPMVAVVDTKGDLANKSPAEQEQKQLPLSGLTKEQLEAYVNDPFWRRVRMAVLLLFCAIWVALFATVIVIVVASPKCPPRPTRQFWQGPLYRIQVAAFSPADAEEDDPAAVGTVAGVTRRLSHLRDTLGVNNFLLGGGLLPVGPSGCPTDFAALRPAVGTLESLKALTKSGRKKGFNVLLELDLSQADPTWGGADASGFVAGPPGGLGGLRSRDSGDAWAGGRLHLPRGSCDSLNVTSPAVMERLEAALTFWLDAGVSGIVLANVAFVAPSAATLSGGPPLGTDWFTTDPSPALYSNASVAFVRRVRARLVQEAGRLGRDLALFVDPGNTGFPQPADRLAAYLDPTDGAHAVVSVGLGRHLSDRATPEPAAPRQLVASVLAAAADRGSVVFATAWPGLRRPATPLLTALSLTLPGVPCIYYGQELGMAHVPGVRLRGDGASTGGYLPGDDSTDAAETPMQWAGGSDNAGWLANDTVPLAWVVNLTLRADDIRAHNLRRLGASGHPQSALQLVRQLLSLIGEAESLQWGGVTFLSGSGSGGSGLLAFKRQAVRFPAVLVVANADAAAATVDLSDGGAATGQLRVMHSGGGGGGSDYQLGKSYSLDRIFVPGLTLLAFLADA